jgi:hypothetical protein
MTSHLIKVATYHGGKVELQDLHFHLESQSLTLLVETRSLTNWRTCERNKYTFNGLQSFESCEFCFAEGALPEMSSDGIYELVTPGKKHHTYLFLFDFGSLFRIEAQSFEVQLE